MEHKMCIPTLNTPGRTGLILLALALVAGLVSACGGANPTPDRVATRVAEELSISATLTALAPPPPTVAETRPEGPTVTPTRARAEVVPVTTSTRAPDNATPEPVCRVASAGLNLRPGPGVAFNPPVAALARGTEVRPLSFVARGAPGGQWVEVEVQATGQRGWVSAGSQFLSCGIDVTALPAGVIPATPVPAAATPVPTPTRILAVVVPVDGSDGNQNLGNGRNSNSGRNVLLPGFLPANVTNPVVFGDRIVFQVEVFDRTAGQYDGAGIRSVRFTITDNQGNIVHDRNEQTPGYCAFGGGEPACDVWRFSEHNNHWPNGANLRSGLHSVQILITPTSGDAVSWFWSFLIQ